MTWLTPIIAAVAAAIAIPALIILYFLKLRRRDVEVSSTLLWKKAIEDLQANAPFQKLRRNILLLLQLLALIAAVVALGQPQFMGEAPRGARHVIVIDRSASMATVDADDGGRAMSRLERAKRDAAALVDSLREPGLFRTDAADLAMVIAFDTSAEVRQAFTADKSALKRALAAIEPAATPTVFKQASQLIQANAPIEFLRDEAVNEQGEVETRLYKRPPGPVGTIHIWSDGRIADAHQITFGPEDVVIFNTVGDPESANLGITSLRATRAYDDPDRLSIFVGIESTAREARAVDVELVLDDVPARIETVAIPAASRGTVAVAQQENAAAEVTSAPLERWRPGAGGVVFEVNRREGGVVAVSLRAPTGAAPDPLAIDDTAWLVVPPSKRMAVAVVTRGNLFIADALDGMPLSKREVLSPDEFDRLLADGGAGEYDVVILDGHLPLVGGEGEGEEPAMPPGRYLILNAVPPPPLGPVDEGHAESPAVVLGWDRDHPVLRNLTLDNVYIFRPRKVEAPEGSGIRVIATSDAGPAILELASAATRAILVPFDVAESNWGFEVSWVVFLASATQYLGEEGSSGVARMVQPGQTLTDRLPIGARNARIVSPSGASTALVPAADGSVVFGPVNETGVYVLSWEGPAGAADLERGSRVMRPFTANLLDGAESDITPATVLETASAVIEVDAERQAARARRPQRLWPWLLLGALLVILVEWWVYNRKVHV